MTCPICEHKGEKIFEDDHVVVFQSPQPAVSGHMIMAPKEHFSIMELVPEPVLAKIGLLTKKFSASIIEKGATGANILISNGEPAGQTEPHFSVHLFPRTDGDGIDLGWQPGKAEPAQLDEILQKLTSVGQAPLPVQTKPDVEPTEDYLLKSLDRIP